MLATVHEHIETKILFTRDQTPACQLQLTHPDCSPQHSLHSIRGDSNNTQDVGPVVRTRRNVSESGRAR